MWLILQVTYFVFGGIQSGHIGDQLYSDSLVDPWLTEKRVDRKKMTVDRTFFFSKNNTFCME